MEFKQLSQDQLKEICAIEQIAQINPWTSQMFMDAMQAGNYCCVLEVNNNVLGYAVLSVVTDEAELLNICIHSNYQSQGYGKALFKHLVEYAKQHKVQKIFLEVHEANQQAVNFYRNCGLQQFGVRKDYYRHTKQPGDALILVLNLYFACHR